MLRSVLSWEIEQLIKDKILFSRNLLDNTGKALGPEDNRSL